MARVNLYGMRDEELATLLERVNDRRVVSAANFEAHLRRAQCMHAQ